MALRRKDRIKRGLPEAFTLYFAQGWWMDCTPGSDDLYRLWGEHRWTELNEIYQQHKDEVIAYQQDSTYHDAEPYFESVVREQGL